MSNHVLKSLDISNFRSIRGKIHAPLDAKVVLVHGENGAGKTSLLSAIELTLTGKVQSLERADPSYDKQLLHRRAKEGSVHLQVLIEESEKSFKTLLNQNGYRSINVLEKQLANFFRERTFLPQSLLSQLLQIYQNAGGGAASPLAQFVSELLGLGRLDSLEAGLHLLADVRNVRKNVEGWQAAENEKLRLERLLSTQRSERNEIDEQLRVARDDLVVSCASIELPVNAREDTLNEVEAALFASISSEVFADLADQKRRLESIRREIDAAQNESNSGASVTPENAEEARQENEEHARLAFSLWMSEYDPRVSALRSRVESLLPDVSLPNDPEQFGDLALLLLRAEVNRLFEHVSQARSDISRYIIVQDELEAALRKRHTIDEEIARLPGSAGSLGSALAELTSFISDETCPVCDRDFSEVSEVALSEHVRSNVRVFSASAERLLTVGRTRSEVRVVIDQLKREIEAIAVRKLDEESIAELDRKLSAFKAILNDIEGIKETLSIGARLRSIDIDARRRESKARSSQNSLAAAFATLNEFAISIGAPALEESEPFERAAFRLNAILLAEEARLELRRSIGRKSIDLIATIRLEITRRQIVSQLIEADDASLRVVDEALERAQALRGQGNVIRGTVDKVRSVIVRREFNERLNLLWRDLFVRLAPGEPFIPAFQVPKSSTRRLQPKLVTQHRDGGNIGGTPGAMLSAGNLNTAALTLFIALHLSMPRELPWLILDDPVQSMDDVHIAHFAALLRTLAKEHSRQIIIAVHDRQLFEYLKLELSPAFSDDSLLTLELSRGARRDSICISRRYSFREETTLRAIA